MNKLNLRTFRLATGLGLLLLLQLPAGFGLAEDAGDAAANDNSIVCWDSLVHTAL